MLEDSALDAELAVARLRKAQLEPQVTLARDRASFEDALQHGPYDLVLADYALPDFDGIAALRLARERMPHTPFIFISGRVGEEVAIDTLQRGATDYVLKHRLERLVPAVVRALKEAEEHSTRMEVEAKFRESEVRFRHVIDAVPQLIWVATPEGRLTYSNQMWHDSVAVDATHWPDPRLYHANDYDRLMTSWRGAIERTEPFSLEIRLLRRSDRTWRWHLLRVTPMTVDSAREGETEINWLGTATDLQDQKLNEEALRTAEKLSVTGRMAAAIAHEINNPLESLTNLIFLVKLESAENERAMSYLNMTENELERISSITKQTLQFYRDPSSPVAVDTRQILEDVLRLFATRMAAKGIQTSLRVPEGLTFQAIKGEIRQVLINLISNAIDAVAQRGRIDVEGNVVQGSGESWVEILVHDDGSGITDDQVDRLFQPFFSTKGAHGTGLGLWVSKGIVEKHGGTLRLGNDLGETRRTTASVRLPLKAVAELQPDEAGVR